MAFMGLNKCAKCGCEIEQRTPAYFRLNAWTDRFELMCEGCYTLKKEQPTEYKYHHLSHAPVRRWRLFTLFLQNKLFMPVISPLAKSKHCLGGGNAVPSR